MHMDRNADLDARPHRILIELFPALGDVNDLLAELVSARPARFLEREHASRRVFRDGAATVSCSCGGSRAGCLRPGKRSGDCQRHAKQCLFHSNSLSICFPFSCERRETTFSHEQARSALLLLRIRRTLRSFCSKYCAALVDPTLAL